MTVVSVIQGKVKGKNGINGVAERRRVSVTSAQLLAMFTIPQVLVPAPGAGKAVEVISVTGSLTAGTQYTG